MKKFLMKISAILLFNIFCTCSILEAQTKNEALKRLTALRVSFINDIKPFGYNLSLPSPVLTLDNPVSFGNYDDTTNILHTTSNWDALPQELKDFFNQAAKRADSSQNGESFFERATHKWIFVHELGHWWRACQKQKVPHYDEEMGANRIAVAYWREKDPAFMDWQLKVFEHFVSRFPNPVPKGISKEKYLNDNYDTIGGEPAYTWYQAEMIIEAYYEKPTITFKMAITNAVNLSRKK